MPFMWDTGNIEHIARHQITPEEAEQVLGNDPFHLERQIRNGEERSVYLGETDEGRVLLVVLTVRDETLRVVTAHSADRTARKFYALRKGADNGKGT